MLRFFFILSLFGLATPTIAAPAPAAAGVCTAAEYRQLDFWLGDWDTFEPGATAGPSEARAHVDAILGGCGIHELYEQTDGLVGDSFLSYDAARGLWQQTWLTNRGSIMRIAGAFKDGALTLQGEMHTKAGKLLLQKITWKAEGKGVRESSVMSKDGGKTWQPAFDVIFLKHAD